jgi:outer membrane protein assembly factor BamB
MLSLRRTLAVFIGLGMASLAGLTGCQTANSSAFSPPADLQAAGLRQQWTMPVTIGVGENVANTWRVGDSIYLTTTRGRVVRLTAAGGKAWEVDLLSPKQKIFRPAEVPGTNNVLVVTRTSAYLIDKSSGQIIRQSDLNFAADTDPIATPHNTFCVGGSNYFYAIFIDQLGGTRWRVAAPENDSYIARPAVQAETILLATEKGRLSKVNMETGDWLWRDRKTDGPVRGGLAADARAVYVPCLDGQIYAVDFTSGARNWTRRVPGTLDRALWITRSDLLVPTGTALYSLSPTKGNERWHAEGVRDVGTVAGDRVWVLDSAGTLKALALENGEVLASAPAPGARIVANHDEKDKNIILVQPNGTVTAYASK